MVESFFRTRSSVVPVSQCHAAAFVLISSQPTPDMKICLYIPCRNGATTLPEVFAAVSRQTRKPDLSLLVDDQSSDTTIDIAEAAGWHTVRTTAERNGLSAARNLAATLAHDHGCDVIAGIDADAVPSATYVEELERFYSSNPHMAGTCGNMRERHTATPSDLWRAVFMRQHWGDEPLENPPILFGSSAAHRVAILQQAGGYDETLRTNFEDTELTQRLLRAGHRLAYVPTLASEHLKRDTADSVLRMFWNWFRPPADMAGHFQDVGTWLRHRHPWVWRDYGKRLTGQAALPRLTALTTALPWTQVMRDLQHLAERVGTPVNLTQVAELAASIHDAHGFPREFIRWLRERLDFVQRQCGVAAGDPLNPAIISQIREHAELSIPRRTYWDDLSLTMSEIDSTRLA